MKYLENFLKISLQEALKTSWRHLEEVLKTFLQDVWRWCEDVLKMSWQDVLKMSWRRFCETSWRRLEDIWPRRVYWSWPKRPEDVFWRRMTKANLFVFIETSWRRLLKEKMKTSSSRRMFGGLNFYDFFLTICINFLFSRWYISFSKWKWFVSIQFS